MSNKYIFIKKSKRRRNNSVLLKKQFLEDTPVCDAGRPRRKY